LWEYVLKGIGTDGFDNGISRWFVGDFVGDKTLDVGIVYTPMWGTSLMQMIDGATGKLAWTREPFVFPGYQEPTQTDDHAQPPSTDPKERMKNSRLRKYCWVGCPPIETVYDFDKDGKDDIAYQSVWYTLVLSGRDGSMLSGKFVTDIYPRTLNYPYTILADVDHNGEMDIVLHGAKMHTMAQTWKDMKMLWWSTSTRMTPPTTCRRR